ncbi:unnamed protein product [Blepharisma stoltei]|uniref:Uncharacterized protein n=1 Tax=Blepharisma stoltei TaxID=1481888 RepID=A0AAU9IUX5_9CILI|nr:unnamed protein product [Blepharisma stoltei]
MKCIKLIKLKKIFIKMESYRHGDLVWTKCRNSQGILARVCDPKFINLPIAIKRTKRANAIFLCFLHEPQDYHHVSITKTWRFKEKFFECAEQYYCKYDKGGNLLNDAVNELNWKEGIEFYNQIYTKYLTLPQKRKKPKCSKCQVCNKSTGRQVVCQDCGLNTVHKNCGGLKSEIWTCSLCDGMPSIKRSISDPFSESLPTYERSLSTPVGTFSIPPLQIDNVIQNIIDECNCDEVLSSIITQRQIEYNDIKSEKKEIDRIVSDLVDQLQCAHTPGFESMRKLQKMYGRGFLMAKPEDLEDYKKAQREVVIKLLETEIVKKKHKNSISGKKEEVKEVSSINSFLDPNKENSVHNLMKKTIDKMINLKIEDEKPKLTYSKLADIVKVIIDGTLTNCEYGSGSHIDHIGGGTNPELLKSLLDKIKDKYIDN